MVIELESAALKETYAAVAQPKLLIGVASITIYARYIVVVLVAFLIHFSDPRTPLLPRLILQRIKLFMRQRRMNVAPLTRRSILPTKIMVIAQRYLTDPADTALRISRRYTL